MFVKLEGRPVLLVSACKVGGSKIRGLLDTGARLRVVALEATDAMREWARAGEMILVQRQSLASREACEAMASGFSLDQAKKPPQHEKGDAA